MEVFGQTLLRAKKVTADDQARYEKACEDAKANESLEMPEPLKTCEVVNVADLASTPYVAVVFTAEYCPPCEALRQPLQEFCDLVNKEQQRMQVVVVTCDKRKEEYE